MSEFKFRNINADELEVRVAEKKNGRMNLLIYKDSRVDMRILDETVGNENWVPIYKREGDTLLCGIGIWSKVHNAFIYKWAAGAPSNYEATKGEQSDALKRAGFVWGIGRGLYSAPKIRIAESNATFRVKSITYDDNDQIKDLQIVDWNDNIVFNYEDYRFSAVEEEDKEVEIDRVELLKTICGEIKNQDGVDKKELTKFYYFYESKAEGFGNWNEKIIRKLWNSWNERR